MELQKYYSENGLSIAVDVVGPFYYASEADAAFAEMRRNLADQERATEVLKKYCDSLIGYISDLKREHAEEISGLRKQVDDLICAERDLIALGALAKDEYKRDADMLIRQHAEEIESIRKQWDDEQWRIQKLEAEAIELRKQAGRYEKLRSLSPSEFWKIWNDNFFYSNTIDELVDQLPASGEK